MESDDDKANDAHENIQEVSKRKAKDKLTINQITQLHNVYTNEYIVDLEKHTGKNKQRKTIRSIAEDLDFKRSTVSDYFKRFKENPNYLNEQLQSHRNSAFHLARKYKPKAYSLTSEQLLVEWILRARQSGILVSFEEI